MATPPPPPLHANLKPLDWIIGTWTGAGTVILPEKKVEYTETITFSHVGKPFIAYESKTKHGSSGAPLHAESGYLKVGPNASVSVVLSSPTGISEVLEGDVKDGVLSFKSTSITRCTKVVPPAVTAEQRAYTFHKDSGKLTYTQSMSTERTPEMYEHLKAELTKA